MNTAQRRRSFSQNMRLYELFPRRKAPLPAHAVVTASHLLIQEQKTSEHRFEVKDEISSFTFSMSEHNAAHSKVLEAMWYQAQPHTCPVTCLSLWQGQTLQYTDLLVPGTHGTQTHLASQQVLQTPCERSLFSTLKETMALSQVSN